MHSISFREGFKLVGFHSRRFQMDVMETWEKLRSEKGKLDSLVKFDASFGISHTNLNGEFHYFAGYLLNNREASVPEYFEVLSIERNRYAIFTHKGHASDIIKTKDKIWSEWLPGMEVNPILNSFVIERFDYRFNELGNANSEMEIWIPIEAG